MPNKKSRMSAKHLKGVEKGQQKLTNMFMPATTEYEPAATGQANRMCQEESLDVHTKVIIPHKEDEVNLPVTFSDFLKFTNVLDITTNAIKAQRPTTYKSLLKNRRVLLETARNAFLTFYTRPNYRYITPIIVNPECPAKIKEHIFEIPEKYRRKRIAPKTNLKTSEEDCTKKQQYNADGNCQRNFRNSVDTTENGVATMSVDAFFPSVFRFPVTLNKFRANTLHSATLDAIMWDISAGDETEFEKLKSDVDMREELLLEYYHSFYMKPVVRMIYDIKLKPCPAAMKRYILKIPFKSEEATVNGIINTS